MSALRPVILAALCTAASPSVLGQDALSASSSRDCLPSAAPAPVSSTDAQTTLRARGIPGEPPIIQSLIGAELGATQPVSPAEKADTASALLTLRQIRETVNPAPTDAEDTRQLAARIGQRMEALRHSLLAAQTGRAAGRTTKSSEGAAGLLADTPGGPAPRLSNATLRMQAGTQAIGASEQFKVQVRKDEPKLAQDYRQMVTDVLVLAAIRAASATVDEYTKSSVTDANVKTVVAQILGVGNANVPDALSHKLGKFTLEDLSNAPATVVATALQQYANSRDANTLADLTTRLHGEITTTGASVLQKVNDIEGQLNASAQQMNDLAQALSDETEALKTQTIGAPSIINVSADMVVMQSVDSAIWGQLSPDEKLAALDEGFFANQGVDTEKLKQSLVASSKVLDARDRALGTLKNVGQLGQLAASLGVPIDTYNLSRNIDTASSTINVVASIATGNWVGALSAGSSILGGGGPDGTQLALAAISHQLDKVIAQQKQILQKLDDLSNQLQASTDKILRDIDDVKRMVDKVLVYEEQQAIQGFDRCEEFMVNATDYHGMMNGLFPSYAQRLAHFNDALMADRYGECINYLDSVKDVRQKGTTGSTTYLNTVYLANSPESKPVADGYQTMLHHSLHLLGMPDLRSKPNCVKRMTWAASLGARYFSDLNVPELSCGRPADGDIPAEALHCTGEGAGVGTLECRTLRLTNANVGDRTSREMDPYYVLATSVVPENVQEIGEILLFITPFESLVERNASGRYRMLSYEKLAAGRPTGITPGRPPNRMLSEWSNAYLNVVNIAVAQQTITSGSLITEATLRVLQQTGYGASAEFPPKSNPTVPLSEVIVADSLRPEYNYAATIWLMQQNPTYAANFIRYFVTKRLAENKVTRPEYAFALKSENWHFISEMLKGSSPDDVPPLNFVPGQGWALVLRQPDGSSFSLPLPPPTVVWANAIAYRGAAAGLFALRETLLDRVILASTDTVCSLEQLGPSAKRLMTLEALGDRQIAQSPVTAINFFTRGRRTVTCNGASCQVNTAAQAVPVIERVRQLH